MCPELSSGTQATDACDTGGGSRSPLAQLQYPAGPCTTSLTKTFSMPEMLHKQTPESEHQQRPRLLGWCSLQANTCTKLDSSGLCLPQELLQHLVWPDPGSNLYPYASAATRWVSTSVALDSHRQHLAQKSPRTPHSQPSLALLPVIDPLLRGPWRLFGAFFADFCPAACAARYTRPRRVKVAEILKQSTNAMHVVATSARGTEEAENAAYLDVFVL